MGDDPDNDSPFVDMEVVRARLEGLELRDFAGVVVFDLTRQRLDADGVTHPLTIGEGRLISVLARAAGEVVPRAELASSLAVTGRVSRRKVDALVNRLRSKLGEHSGVIRAHYGRGYSLRSDLDIVVRDFVPRPASAGCT